MRSLNFPIVVEPVAPHPSDNALALLTEITAAVERLLTQRTPTRIDLQTLPLTAADRQRLQTLLGEGEVVCYLNAFGRSTAQESQMSGVWWITHCDEAEQVIAESIEVADFPAFCAAQPEDMAIGLRQLQSCLEIERSAPLAAQTEP